MNTIINVKWSNVAENDLLRIIEYIARDNIAATNHGVGPRRSNNHGTSGHRVPQVAASGSAMRTQIREPDRSPQDVVPCGRLHIANARKVFERIKEKTADLNQLPDRGRIVPELQDYGITLYREIIVSPWRIIYRSIDKAVHVLAVIDSRQNVEDILLNRLIKELKIC